MTSSSGDRGRLVAVVVVTGLAYAAALHAFVTQPVLLDMTGRLTFSEVVNTVGFGTAFLGLPVVGGVLAVRRPRNPIGRTLLAFGAGLYALLSVAAATELAVARTGSVAPGLMWLAALTNHANPVLLALAVHLLLYFPDGELDRRARWLSRVCIAVTCAVVVARLLRPARLDFAVEVANPFGQAWAAPLDGLIGPLTLALLALAIVALGRLIRRFRAAGEIERTQFRWILSSLTVLPASFALSLIAAPVVGSDLLSTVLQIGGYNLGVLGFSFALYRAVTKQDLYGIGRVVSRSVTYVVLVAVLAGTYLTLVVALGGAARQLTGDAGDLVVAFSTLAVAALFQPVRGRVRSMVDRRFDRAGYDAARTIDAFGRGLRDELGLEAVAGELREVVLSTFRPHSADVVLLHPEGER